MHNKLLVKLIDDDNGRMISAFYTENWSEVLKTYSFLLEGPEISLKINESDNEKYSDTDCYVSDLAMQFGGQAGLNVLEVFVHVV